MAGLGFRAVWVLTVSPDLSCRVSFSRSGTCRIEGNIPLLYPCIRPPLLPHVSWSGPGRLEGNPSLIEEQRALASAALVTRKCAPPPSCPYSPSVPTVPVPSAVVVRRKFPAVEKQWQRSQGGAPREHRAAPLPFDQDLATAFALHLKQ